MSKPTTADLENILVAHMAATTAAFQVLVSCLQHSGALERGHFQTALTDYMEMAKDRTPPETLALLHDLRMALSN